MTCNTFYWKEAMEKPLHLKQTHQKFACMAPKLTICLQIPNFHSLRNAALYLLHGGHFNCCTQTFSKPLYTLYISKTCLLILHWSGFKMEFVELSSTIQPTLFPMFYEKWVTRFLGISSCFEAKEMMELRCCLYGISIRGSSSQFLRRAIIFMVIPMSTEPGQFESQSCLIAVYTAGRQKQRRKKIVALLYIYKGTKLHLRVLTVRTYEKKYIMWSGEHRRSSRIVELDAQKAQQSRNRNKGIVIHELLDEEELDRGQDVLKRKREKKKVKVRTVQDLIVSSVEYKVQKLIHTDSRNDEDRLVNAVIVPSGAALPEKSKLELLLGILQRRDTRKIFAEPVNGEEVEYYYDVIKEPMDFGTIEKKLNEGSYQNLDELEHDVFLVFDNAMLFNASTTVYYRQARALKKQATRLFHILKTDPENFETEAPIRRARKDRGKRVDDFEVEKRQTYTRGSPSDNGSLISTVYNSPKHLLLDANADFGYVESLKRFVKELGPTAKMVAMKKIKCCISEGMKIWNSNAYSQFQGPEMQIPGVFASSIKVPQSFEVTPSSASSTSWSPPSHAVTRLNSDQTIDYISRIGSLYPGKGACQNEDVYKPSERRMLPLTEYCFQGPTTTPDMASLLQKKGELDSLCAAPALEEDWLVSSPQENIMGALSNALEQERFQPQNIGGSSSSAGANRYQKQPVHDLVLALPCTQESSSSAAATDRYQKQPVQSKELPQWKWI